MPELNFTRAEYDRAALSGHDNELALLADHHSQYIRARVAGNPCTSRGVRDALQAQAAEHSGVLVWLLANPACTREEFVNIYSAYIGRVYDGNAHLSLATSPNATTRELSELLHINHWCVTMAVLNNFKGRDTDEYRDIIKFYLPNEDQEPREWNQVEKLAYYRTTGRRRPNPV